MPPLDQLLNNHVLCQELRGQPPRTGVLHFTHKSIDTRFVSYEEHLSIQTEQPLFLRTEYNDIVSLYGNLSAGTGHRYRHSEAALLTLYQEVTSNLALIGNEPWGEDDRVMVATFDLRGASSIFENRNALRRLSKATLEEIPAEPLLIASGSGCSASIRYKFRYSFSRDAVADIAPFVHVQFDQPTTIYDYYDAVMCIAQFASCATGFPHTVQAIALYQRAWPPPGSDPSNHPDPYLVHYPRVAGDTDETKLSGASVWNARTDASMQTLQRALSEWMRRHDQWRAANAMMMGAISSRTVLSSERIVNACRWFESLPNVEYQQRISQVDLDTICAAAQQKALELGHGNLGHRMGGALKRIGTESHTERFERLASSLNERFGGAIQNDRLVADLLKAIEFRNKCAHGNFFPTDDTEERAFLRSTLAMEAFCFLMTLEDLPLDLTQTARIANHRIVSDYSLCH